MREAWDKLVTAKEYSDRNPALNTRCTLALDAAELAVKAVIIARNSSHRDTHDVVDLLTTAQRMGERIPPAARDAGRLNSYGGADRYGHLKAGSRPTTKREYDRVIQIAQAIVEWAHERVHELVPQPDGPNRTLPRDRPRRGPLSRPRGMVAPSAVMLDGAVFAAD